jgi:mRNA interferase MazF
MEIIFGGIYLVNFDPSVGSEYQKVRPALVIQSNEITACSSLVTVMPISSKIEKKNPDDILIRKNNSNKLLSDSLLKVQQISSFDKKRFIHVIGKVDDEILLLVGKYLQKHFKF